MKMNLKPALRYQFGNFLGNIGVVFIIFVAMLTVFSIISLNVTVNSSTVSFSGSTIVSVIFMFVLGIVTIRSDMRLCIQFGTSRRTAFCSGLLAVLLASLVLALSTELLTAVAQRISVNNTKFFVFDIYQMFYVGDNIKSLSLMQHLHSIMLNTSMSVFFFTVGMFFSLIFWRLNTIWTIVVAISIPLLMNLIPYIIFKLGVNLTPFINWIGFSVLNAVLVCILLAIAFTVISWLLLRKANIKEAK